MTIRLGLISALIAFSSSVLSATTCEQYVSACVNNKNNRMEEQQCKCVWEAASQFTDDQRAFLIAAAGKDQAKTQALMVKLGQQVAPVMMFVIQQTPLCAGMEPLPSQQDPATAGATSTDAAAAASGTAASAEAAGGVASE